MGCTGEGKMSFWAVLAASFLTWNSNFFTEASSELSTNMTAHINSSIIIHYNSSSTIICNNLH
jgi:hypothetical protein